MLSSACRRFISSPSAAAVIRSSRAAYAPASPPRAAYSSISATEIAERTKRMLDAKEQSGLSYDELASKLGVTNTYTAQLLMGQAKLTSETAIKLQEALPDASKQDIEDMTTAFPMRAFDEEILKEPNVYRTYEAITHYGEAIKSIINEQCGDGIMSAIDFYCDVGTTTGKHGEKRVVITFNGKFLPHIEQKMDDDSAKSPRD
ncbi:cyanate hydratase [Skeletonema marinoi]|uniref:Cyanate hydratase n=1 Tax=Skeletonema marinoi TaxID=267567 RepID=A0AAD8Y5M1_9STRA|nr:cyanate hydratase [Skeletonema marinoi]